MNARNILIVATVNSFAAGVALGAVAMKSNGLHTSMDQEKQS
ncbi:MAG: hypothetical protein WCO56_23650 [Verrucomicrobiota bacterium]